MEHPTPTYLPKHSWTAIAVAAALTGIFHTLLYGQVVGLPMVIFSVAAVAGVHALVAVTGKRGNTWAYLFLAPFLLSVAAQAVFAGGSVRFVSLLVILVSFLSFAYWFALPAMRLEHVKGFWPFPLILDSLLPFDHFGKMVEPLARGRSHWRKVIVGVVLAVPFLVVFVALFIGADQLVQKTFVDTFRSLLSQETVAKLFVDTLVFLFLVGAGWTVITRLIMHRVPTWSESTTEADATIAGTFLGLLNALFLAFLGFQFVYFFGGESFLQTQGVTYASYAREGFAQLLAAALLVCVIVMGLYRLHALKHVMVRALSGLLILQTAVISVSAIRRLLLYVDAYGLTVSRYWALVVIILTMAVLAVILVASLVRLHVSSLMKMLTVGVLVLVAAINLLNVEGFVAKVNVDRFLSGSLMRIDTSYLLRLSSDAIPELVRLKQAGIPVENESHVNPEEWRQLHVGLQADLENLQKQSQDWRKMVISDYRALGSLSTLFVTISQ